LNKLVKEFSKTKRSKIINDFLFDYNIETRRFFQNGNFNQIRDNTFSIHLKRKSKIQYLNSQNQNKTIENTKSIIFQFIKQEVISG
jgi:hypothetical protein